MRATKPAKNHYRNDEVMEMDNKEATKVHYKQTLNPKKKDSSGVITYLYYFCIS